MSIYKPSEIRGDEQDLSPEMYRSWGIALGQQVEPGAKFVVGGDVRTSTARLLAGLIDGLCRSGLDVVDLGALPTPMIRYAERRLEAAGSAIVTGSHSAARVNGLKWTIGGQPPSQKAVRALKQAVEGEPSLAGRTRSTSRSVDVSYDYVAWLQETWAETPAVQRPVILDPMNGCWGCRARRYLQAVFPHSVFFSINDTPDGTFGGRTPDCARSELLEDLSRAVEHHGAYLGIAFDGDGDRVAFVDESGAVLNAEEATWALLRSLGDGLCGQSFVYDLKFSERVPEASRSLGAEPLMAQSGTSGIRSRMTEAGALFGAEVRGHYFFRELAGSDDAVYAACLLIAHLGRTGASLAEIRRDFPEVFVTPDLHLPVKPRAREAILQQIRDAWAEYPQSEIDGVRVQFKDGWALVRSPVKEPDLVFRFEAGDWPALIDLVFRFCEALPDVGEALWTSFQQAMGLLES